MTADYTYDALGRRLEKRVNRGGAIEKIRYVWDGWQVIEERDGSGNLTARYTYGNGLDEPVEIERKDPATGQLRSYVPMQDTNGNVLGMADAEGNLIEKVSYTPYGGATFIYDHEKPKIDQIKVKGTGSTEEGRIKIRFSEEVTEESARSAIKVKQGVSTIAGSFSFEEENRLAIFAPSSALPNALLTIIVTTALEDKSGNKLASEFSQEFTYAGVDLIVYDRVAPEIEKIIYESGKFKIEFAEEIDHTSITNGVELKSGNVTIGGSCTLQDEKVVVFTPNQTPNAGTVNIKPVIRDLAGKTTAAFNVDYDLSSGDNLIYERPKENEHSQSYIKNTTLFQGRELDYETGLYYFRNRHLNPELGRFMQADPLGYHDSMNLYQAMGNNPINFTDPMGTVVKAGIDPLYVSDMYNVIRKGGRSHKEAYQALLQSEYVTDTGRKEDELYQMGLAAQPSLDAFNVTPGQFGKDVAGGVINFGVGIMGMAAQGLAQGNPVSTYQISRAQNAVSSKINSAIGANENSLGYWMGGTYSAAIAGGIFAAELESVTASAQTKSELPFLKSTPILRQKYTFEVAALKNRITEMRSSGMSSEQIARTLHAERRALGIKFKDLTPDLLRQKVFLRNLKKYNDPFGPSIEWLREHNKSWDEIIESATRTGGKDIEF